MSKLSRRSLIAALPLILCAPRLSLGAGAVPDLALARAAAAQVGVVTIYDPAYVSLSFPNGDVAPERGVCTDVLIRALRVAHGVDLQQAINADMKGNFSAYPALWGLKRTDRNIDHRRVPNLRRLFERMGAELPLSEAPEAYLAGDVVTCLIPGDLAHLMVVGEARSAEGDRPLIVHNIGAGTRVEDRLFEFKLTGHYRLGEAVREKLKRLGA